MLSKEICQKCWKKNKSTMCGFNNYWNKGFVICPIDGGEKFCSFKKDILFKSDFFKKHCPYVLEHIMKEDEKNAK